MKSALLIELETRGFLNQCTDLEGLDELASKESLTVYVGFDCTSDSLHVGNLMALMLLRLFKKHGHNVIPLIGTGTTRIGDPSGKSTARPLLDDQSINRNAKGILQSIRRVVDVENLVDNGKWLLDLNLVDFLRTVGSKISVSKLLALESVKTRLDGDEGMSFLEFNYSLFQAFDFLRLHQDFGVNVQIGGSDQWGNIIMGTELIRKTIPNANVFGLTFPLLTNNRGEKMGKTVNGAVWLNDDKLSDFEFWQFWRNVDDNDVFRLMRLFTNEDVENINAMEETELEFGGTINLMKQRLATAITSIVRGEEAAQNAVITAQTIFKNGGVTENMKSVDVKINDSILDILVVSGLCSSKSDAKRNLDQNAIRLNNNLITDLAFVINDNDFIDNMAKLSKGKKNHICLIKSP
jgi:tyrosyl-tRNA synthetase